MSNGRVFCVCDLVPTYQQALRRKHYVGVTRRKVEQRICEHKRSKQYVDREIQRLGWEGNFDWWITESNVSANLITEREQYWINFLSSIFPNGYNKTCGGIRYFKYSEETIEAMRQSHLGKHHTEDTLAIMRSRRLSDERKAILSESRMGEKNPCTASPVRLKENTTRKRQRKRIDKHILAKFLGIRAFRCLRKQKLKFVKLIVVEKAL